MDNYESAITALKIPFFPLGLRFPAGDVLKAVIVVRAINFNRPDFLLFLASVSLLMTNDQ